MKKLILMSSLIIISFVFQTSLIGFFNHFKVIPNFPLILLVIFAMLSDGVIGGVLGFLTGILFDAMIYDIFGLYTLIYFLIGAIIGTFSDEMLRENQIVYSVAAGASTVLMHLLLYLILFFLRFRVQSAKSILPNILFETALNAVLVVFILKAVIYLFDRFNVKV
ncbi:MAG: rod shape-determining protein MreD [Tissierellia bacterium]|nr:rod shape-determining protein MreD [Tissierellia bacterium]MDD4438733.1 rod shape-determining protein MreD [Tissierellia bacterium]